MRNPRRTWRTTFERVAFNHADTIDGPSHPLANNLIAKDTVTVTFTTAIPFENETIGKFLDVAWAAMWKQYPRFSQVRTPCPWGGFFSWSSVGGAHKFEEVIK